MQTISRLDFYNSIQQQEAPNFNEKMDLADQHLLSRNQYTEELKTVYKRQMSRLKAIFRKMWSSSSRIHEIFIKKHGPWLQGSFQIPGTPSTPSSAGRPRKSFVDSSERSKRRKTEQLRKDVEPEAIVFVAETCLTTSGKRSAATVLKDLKTSPKRAGKYKKAYRSSLEPTKKSPLEALLIFTDAGLTKSQYEIVRTSDKKQWPCYSVLVEEKKTCYPDPDSFTVTERLAEVDLHSLLNHTAERLVLYLEEVIKTLTESGRKHMKLSTKWGCDGSQQTQFNQKFEDDSNSDASIFQCSMVPLQLTCGVNKKVIWQNPTPSSPRFCRPIRIRFIKETADVIAEEIAYMENKIAGLKPTQLQDIAVEHVMMLTMIDGKVCNAATTTKSTMRCYICGATSRQFNDLDRTCVDNQSSYKFGLSILHARIRCFESLLHLSYKLPVKKWQKRLNEDEKRLISDRKKKIQDEFKSKMGILVDIPKVGFGNTNNGNTSRRFFNDPETSADITGVDFRLISRMKIILEVISSGHKIDVEKFRQYTLDTAKLYVELYPWCPMTPTLHKVLVHGPDIVENALLPIGQLSEEAADTRNKHFREYRLSYARKFSRKDCNQDIINRLLLTSDPLLSSIGKKKHKLTKPFSKEAVELLLPGEVQDSDTENNENEEYSDNDEVESN